MDLLNHAFYAVTRPWDCLCEMCMSKKKCAVCKKPARIPIKAQRTKLGYRPYCEDHAIAAARVWTSS